MAGYDGDGDLDENGELSPTVLHSEAAGLLGRAGKLLETYSEADRLKVESIIHLLKEAISGDDIDRLQSAIDEATDALIELEL